MMMDALLNISQKIPDLIKRMFPKPCIHKTSALCVCNHQSQARFKKGNSIQKGVLTPSEYKGLQIKNNDDDESIRGSEIKNMIFFSSVNSRNKKKGVSRPCLVIHSQQDLLRIFIVKSSIARRNALQLIVEVHNYLLQW